MLADRAVLFVDGRYTLQAREQVDAAVFTIVLGHRDSARRWIEANLPAGAKLGYDPWLHTADGAEKLAQGLRRRGRDAGAGRAQSDRRDLDRPAGAAARRRWCCTTCASPAKTPTPKLARIRAEIGKLRADALVVSDPHAVAWTFNIRGADVAHTPLALAFAIVPREGRPTLYVDGRKLDQRGAPQASKSSPRCASPPSSTAIWRRSARPATVRLDQATAADALVAHRHQTPAARSRAGPTRSR